MKVIGVTAPSTGSGKTSVSLALLSSLNNSVSVKVGPDYIDGSLGSAVSGKPAHNLDRWIQGRDFMRRFRWLSSVYDFAVVEGVMGMYDSGSPVNLSTDYYFRKIGIPYILVIDVSKLAESAYYIAKGFIGRNCIGVVINNFYSEKHLIIVRKAFSDHGVPIIGEIPHAEELKIPERHLGLKTAGEMPDIREKAVHFSQFIDFSFIDKLKDIPLIPEDRKPLLVGGGNIYVAYDNAFNFYYGESLDFLGRIGKLHYFSPLKGEIPENPHMIYLGGGYPELYASKLAEKSHLNHALKTYSDQGVPILAECGGLMYLESTFESKESSLKFPGIFGGSVKMTGKLTLGYTKLNVLKDNLLFRRGEVVYGHEYHYSDIEDSWEKTMQNVLGKGIQGYDGLYSMNTQGSYSHFDLMRYGKRLSGSIAKFMR
ncbi:cobyrinate a,c-diamide synthase [Oxyplasma meridianum]|uniref:Cobyrinate a,c-diamide synthase n=1 Tax=Oxyplasma meridianum TaxID=3073602 RepID=A0AAX4NH58_9ARCH